MTVRGMAKRTRITTNDEEARGPGPRETVDDDVGDGRQRVRLWKTGRMRSRASRRFASEFAYENRR